MQKSAVVYARISETDKKVDKVAGQISDLTDFASKNDYLITSTFKDDGISATKLDVIRPGWLALLEAVGRGDFEVVLATEEERFARGSRTDKADLMAACIEGGAVWHTMRDGYVDPNVEGSEVMSDVRDAFARAEIRRKTSRQRSRYDREVAAGNPLWGQRPFGYNRDLRTLGRDVCQQGLKSHENHEKCTHVDEAQALADAYKHIIGGGSIYALIVKFNTGGILTSTGKKWSYATVSQMLRRPRNAGIVIRRGVEQKGVTAAWEPVVSRADWETAAAILNDPKRRTAPGRKQIHLSAGLIFCEVCGLDDNGVPVSVMRSASVTLKGVVTPIYKCASKANAGNLGTRHPTIQMSVLDPLIRPAIVQSFLYAPTNTGPQRDEASTAPLEAQQSTVRAARARLLKVLADPAMGLDEGDVAVDLGKLKKQEDELQTQINQIRESAHKSVMTVDLRDKLFATKSNVTIVDEYFGTQRISGRKVFWSDVTAARDALGEQWDALDLDMQRKLIKAHLRVGVDLGRGTGRVAIEYLLAPGLNDGE